LTLTERFKPKFVITGAASGGSEVERVVVSGDDIEANPDLLGWCLEQGYSVFGAGGDEVFEVMVPWEIWHERDRIPGEIYAPELHGSDAERELADAERECREADRAQELAAARRAEVLRRHSEDMTRQQARAITDLSVGRIQQLIREGLPTLASAEVLMLIVIDSQKPKNIRELRAAMREQLGMNRPPEIVSRQLQQLQERGLVEKTPRGLRLTLEGKETLEVSRERALNSGSGDD